MPPRKRIAAVPSNAGLLKLESLLTMNGALPAAEVPPPTPDDLFGVTDAIAIAFDPQITPERLEAVRAAIGAWLGSGWELRDDSTPGRPAWTALPPVDGVPSIADGWEMARAIESQHAQAVRSADLLVAQVGPDARVPAQMHAMAPTADGPALPPEWHLTLLRVRQAWALWPDGARQPGQGVTVAVLDTGYTKHPEIVPRLAEVPGQPGTVHGFDLLDGADPIDPLQGVFPLATPSHGTAVISVIASPEGAEADAPCAPEGVTGVAPFARIVPVRMTTHVALLGPNKLVPAIREAVDDGADVLNISLGAPVGWAALRDILDYAANQGVIVVAASGNYWPRVVYPAAYAGVVAAAACRVDQQPWPWSGRGETVDVLAPGVDVHRATAERSSKRTRYCTGPSTGTTYAAACSSGLAALWLSYHGGREALAAHYGGNAGRVPQAFRHLLRQTAVRSAVMGSGYGVGIPQADALLSAPLPSLAALDESLRERHLLFDTQADPALNFFAPYEPLFPAASSTVRAEDALRALLPLEPTDPRFPSLVRELHLQISSRPALVPLLRRLLDTSQADALREALLESAHLSSTLRTLLRAGGTLAAGAAAPAAAADAAAALARRPPPPRERRLQVFSSDPSLAAELRTIDYDRLVVGVRWEPLQPGPVGEYLEVVDVDPASRSVYAPVNLDDPHLLGADGLAPDEADPQFHQQMVYAVAMMTIGHFERALGRPAFWATEPYQDAEGRWHREPFVPRLRVFPHAVRARNAYYSPAQRALLFGYFTAQVAPGLAAGTTVFTALSYDIIAHETTHALLDGMYRHYTLPTNPDVHAFHEAFADLVALFQHFTHASVLRAVIEEARGDLEADTILGKLAQQFGRATGRRGALRDAIGTVGADGVWRRHMPDPTLLHTPEYRSSPHLRGSILVAAVFDAFLRIYRRRAQPYLRLATGGSGVLAAGAIPADLAQVLSDVAAKSAEHALHVCIRALDYLPPIDLTFGDYLRALITADRDVVPNDNRGYRVAFAEAFRAWGIFPEQVATVAPDSLRWDGPHEALQEARLPLHLRDLLNRALGAWRINRDRAALHADTLKAKGMLNRALRQSSLAALTREIGIDTGRPFEVHTLRAGASVGPDGDINPLIVATLTQKRDADQVGRPEARTGSTLLFDLGSGALRYVIHQRDRSGDEAESRRQFLDEMQMHAAEADPYGVAAFQGEPFAALHLAGR